MQINNKHVKDRIAEFDLKKFQIEAYDDDNLYPQKIKQITNGSGTATNCVSRLHSFLIGKGLPTLNALVVNNTGDTVFSLLNAVTKDYSIFRGFCVWRKINELNKSVEFYHVPFENVRKCMTDDIENFTAKYAIHNDWGGKVKTDDIQFAWTFSENPDIITEQIVADGGDENYAGQLLYCSADAGKYPLAKIDPVLEDCVVDNQIKIFNYKNITTNFMASHILLFRDEPEQSEKAQILSQLKTVQSAENASKVLALWGLTKDDFSLQKIDIQDHDKLFEVTNETTKQNIREQFGQDLPFFKGGMSSADMSGEAIKTTYSFYNALTERDRMFIVENLNRLFATFYKPIVSNLEIEKLTFEV